MQELAHALTEAASDVGRMLCSIDDSARPLQTAAETWAIFALRNHTGEHLTKALAISAAVSEYVALYARAPDHA